MTDFSFYLNKAPFSKPGNSQYQLESPTFQRDNSRILDVLRRQSSDGSYQMDIQHNPERLYSFDVQKDIMFPPVAEPIFYIRSTQDINNQ